MYQRAEAGGSGEARPDQKMGRKRRVPRRDWVYVHGTLVLDFVGEPRYPTSHQRAAMQRKANAKRRHRDRLLSHSSTHRGE